MTDQVPISVTNHAGRSLCRKEAARLITGQATCVEDVSTTGTLHAAILRPSGPHGMSAPIDTSAVLARDSSS